MAKEIIISSIKDFISEVINSDKNEYYYRGETKLYEYRTPSLYRYENLTMKGSEHYYKELFNEMGYSGIFDSFNFFEKLSELQHYGAKTRMLDISSNPLVALFFACEDGYEQSGNEGFVYVYKENKENINYSDDYKLAIKLALNFIDPKKVNRFISVMSHLHDNIGKYGPQKHVINESATIDELIVSLEDSFKVNDSESVVVNYPDEELVKNEDVLFRKRNNVTVKGEPYYKEEKKEEKREILDFLYMFARDTHYLEYILENNIKNDKDNFDLPFYQRYLVKELRYFLEDFLELINRNSKIKERFIFPNEVYKYIVSSQIVVSSKTNQRITNQRGLYIIPAFVTTEEFKEKNYVPKDFKLVQKKINESIEAFEVSDENKYFKIPSDKKSYILDELMTFGIDDGFIYPDIEHKSKAVLRKLNKNM